MSFTAAVSSCLSKYVVWRGRASRAEYWWFALFVFCVDLVAAILDAAAKSPIFIILTFLGLILPTISVGVRRLHDTGRNGAWYWIVLVPFIGGIILLIFTLLPGDAGSNAYGPPPSAAAGAAGHAEQAYADPGR